MAASRPTGVTVLAVLQFIGAAFSLIGGFSMLALGGLSLAAPTGADPNVAEGRIILFIAGVLLLINGIVGLISGYGLFTLKGWGWLLAIIFAAINIVATLIQLIQGSNVVPGIVGIAISAAIIYYLNQENVKRAFGKA